MKGGSYMCHADYCNRYRTSARRRVARAAFACPLAPHGPHPSTATKSPRQGVSGCCARCGPCRCLLFCLCAAPLVSPRCALSDASPAAAAQHRAARRRISASAAPPARRRPLHIPLPAATLAAAARRRPEASLALP